MLAALVIVFREVMEAGLIIAVILAACRGEYVPKYIVLAGILTGVGGRSSWPYSQFILKVCWMDEGWRYSASVLCC
ncbi:iron permease [Salmonella enterica subsp. enterica serovar Heidelberg str. SARA36]|nr:iron permease [Salmonella enterica subsp. enterica serovar Heidelberg str. SARA36]